MVRRSGNDEATSQVVWAMITSADHARLQRGTISTLLANMAWRRLQDYCNSYSYAMEGLQCDHMQQHARKEATDRHKLDSRPFVHVHPSMPVEISRFLPAYTGLPIQTIRVSIASRVIVLHCPSNSRLCQFPNAVSNGGLLEPSHVYIPAIPSAMPPTDLTT